MISMPPLSSNNHFTVLSVEGVFKSDSISLTDTTVNDSKAVPNPTPPHLRFRRHPKWEKRLPKCYIVALNPSSNSFKLNVSMQTTDTGKVHTMHTLLDSGATSLFINSDFASDHEAVKPSYPSLQHQWVSE
jgi:hypothetical protein